LSEQKRLIANRYELGNLIGRGGMADVYEGIDTRLGRTVAIKLLKSDLANDPSFEDRFRQEAQASARMAHPTIVRVYDAGEDIELDSRGNQVKHPFIVMEYVRGKLLRDILHERRLSIEEAVNYASGVLTALEFSHKAGVIHRDIKSANIMITENDQVKVMDFGIARAISDSSATMANTVGIMGTAQYFSPEQAKGENVDARTDLYSTGVLLYEMLAGRAPFKGESAVSIAYQHVSEAPDAPSTHNNLISAELDQVVLHALAKDRNNRFPSAEEFRDHLIAAANGSPLTLSIPVIQPAEAAEAAVAEVPASETAQPEPTEENSHLDDFEALLAAADTSATSVMPTHPVEKETAVIVPVEVQPVDDVSLPTTNPFASLGVDINAPETAPTSISKSGRPSAGLLWGVGSGVTVVLVGLLVWLISFGANFNFNITPGQSGIAVADVVGKSYTEAYATLTNSKLLVVKVFETNETAPLDQVLRSDPAAGTRVPENTSITLYVSSGAQLILVPSLLGMTEEQAKVALTNAKLNIGTITQANSASALLGQVTATDPLSNAQVAPGTLVNLVISNGKVLVPDVRNLSIDDARSLLTAPDVSLTVSITTKTTCTGTQGTIVVDQSIPAGLTNQMSAIVLYVGCNN
jgi:serine/threonine protein kinase/beta-lactam-binding protein with PASTA domain